MGALNSVRPSMMNLTSKMSQIRGPSSDYARLAGATALKGRETKNTRESMTNVVQHNTVTQGGRQTVGQQMKRSLVANTKTSVTSLASRSVLL